MIEDIKSAAQEIMENTGYQPPTQETIELRYVAYYISTYLLRWERNQWGMIRQDKDQIRHALQVALERLEEL